MSFVFILMLAGLFMYWGDYPSAVGLIVGNLAATAYYAYKRRKQVSGVGKT